MKLLEFAFIFFNVSNITDLFSTIYAINKGATEINILYNTIFGQNIYLFLTFKLIFGFLISYIFFYYGKKYKELLGLAIYFLFDLGFNFLILAYGNIKQFT